MAKKPNTKKKKPTSKPAPKPQRKSVLPWVFGGITVLVLVALIWGTIRGAAASEPIDGIACQAMEGSAIHNHAHLSIFEDGKAVTVPNGIGAGNNSCYYWLHTHDTTGVIHVESPQVREFTLGNFYNIWGKELKADRVYVNGERFTGDPKTIKLEQHTLITVETGPTFVDPPTFTFPAGE